MKSPIKHHAPPKELATPPLSFAVEAGEFVFVSGIPGFNEAGEFSPDFPTQFQCVIHNIRHVLTPIGCDLDCIVKATVILIRSQDLATMNELYRVAFGPPPYPARTTFVVTALPDPRMLLEIECIARLRS